MHARSTRFRIVLFALSVLAPFAACGGSQQWPGPTGPAPSATTTAPPELFAPPISSGPAPSSSTDSAPSASADAAPASTGSAAKSRHQETITQSARAPSQAMACQQAKTQAESGAASKCGSGRVMGKSFAPCVCRATTITTECSATLTVVCEDN